MLEPGAWSLSLENLMSSIFISHSSQDNVFAQEVERRLAQQNHHSVFLDLDPEKGIVAGQSWEQTLYRKLRACRAVVVLCTDHYLRSHWCFAEIALARMEGKHILALQVDPLSPSAQLPSILTEKQFIDLRTHEEEGYRRLWRGLKELDVLGVANEWDPKEPPYLGLNAYQEKHAPLFFGREDEIRMGIELLDRGAPGLIMALGASGSGKSSLVRAGLVPRLRREPERWLVVEPFRPGRNPFTELAFSLSQAYRRYAPESAATVGDPEEIRRRLEEGAAAVPRVGRQDDRGLDGESETSGPPAGDERVRRLINYLEELSQQPPTQADRRLLDFLDLSLDDLRRLCDEPAAPMTSPAAEPGSTSLVALAEHLCRVSDRRGARVPIIVDQFEELFVSGESADRNHRFLALLRASLEAPNSPVMVLGTMRSDFLGQFQQHLALRDIDFESLSLGPMPREGIRRIIEEPAKLGAIKLETGLADRLLEDTETADALPLLSFTLWVLWRDYREDGALEIREYEDLGGLDGAVAAEADAVLASASREGKEDALREAFVLMARLTEEGGYARQPLRWDTEELIPVHDLLERFVERRLLMTRGDEGTRMVEVAHEAIFRSWQPLKAWLDNRRAELLLRQQLRRDALAWQEHARPTDSLWRGSRLQQAQELMQQGKLGRSDASEHEEAFLLASIRQRQRRRRLLATLTLGVFAVLSGFLAYALVEADRAKKETARVRELARASTAQSLLGREPTKAALVLLEMHQPEATSFTLTSEVLGHGIAFTYVELRGHASRIHRARFSPDGQRVVTASKDGTARVWDAVNGRLLHILKGHDHEVLSAGFRADNQQVATASQDGTARLWGVESGALRHVLQGHTDHVLSARFSPDGQRVVTASKDGTARVWDAGRGETLYVLEGHDGEVRSAEFSADGQQVVTASSDKTARLWSAASGRLLYVLEGHDSHVLSAMFSADGKRVVTASRDQTARLWSAESGEPLHVLKGHKSSVLSAEFSSDGKRVATASSDQTARLWNADSGGALHVLQGHRHWVFNARFGADSQWVVTTSNDGTARLWDVESGEAIHVLRGHRGWVMDAGFSPDGQRIVTASRDATARLWSVRMNQPMHVLRGHEDQVYRAGFSPDSQYVASASEDGTARLWSVESGALHHVLRGHEDQVYSAEFSADGQWVVTASKDGTARLWSVESGELRHLLKGHRKPLSSAEFSPDGQWVVTASWDGAVLLWDAAHGKLRHRLEGHRDKVSSAEFSPDSQWVVTASQDHTARLWSVADGELRRVLEGHDDWVVTASFSADSQRVVTASHDTTARLWSVPDGALLHVLKGHDDWMASAVFSADGRQVLTASRDWTARLWDAESGALLHILRGHQGRPYQARFSADGRRVVTASWDRTARLWDVESGRLLHVLRGHESPVNHARFSPDGQRVVTASGDQTVRLWPLTRDLLSRMIRSKTKVCLNPVFRQSQLGESEEMAWSSYAACERTYGRNPGSAK